MIGVAAATLTDGDINQAAQLTKNATAYNRQLHPDEVKNIKKLADAYAEEQNITPAEAEAKLLAEAQRTVDREFYEAHAVSDIHAQSFLRKNATYFLDKDGQKILIFTPGSPQLYSDPTLFAQTWKDYPEEYQAMLGASATKSIAEHNSEIVKQTKETAVNGVGKGVGNYPSDTANALLNLPGQILNPSQEPDEYVPVPFDYNNEVEQEIGAQTQGVIDATSVMAGSAGHAVKKSAEANNKYVDILSPQEKQHILYGDNPESGGHLWPGQTGKTAFPKSWSADKIVHEVGDIVTSPKTKWYVQSGSGGKYTRKGEPARWVSYETRDGIRVRVVYEPATGKVVTAFPDSNPTLQLKRDP